MDVSVFSPAKINLFLAVTGRRADGFHDLVSVVVLLDFGDELQAEESRIQNSESKRFSLECDVPDLLVDETNLILKAAAAFAAATGWRGGAAFRLTKRIPLGAGLGGGSSNAVAALRALNELAGGLLGEQRLAEIAATLGSDCALFVKNAPAVMRGRGERVEALPAGAVRRLSGRRVLVFKPSFGIGTPWAYGRMAARGGDYLAAAEAEARLTAWVGGTAPAEEICFNNMEPAAFAKFVALPVLREKLRREFGVAAQMSGSGSACFALLGEDFVTAPLVARIREDWGPAAFVREARIA
ncbi:MAG: 4-(cytidine 5'-diphospho)-2-C-methyl-D-erythritol kinase [Opitutae bacterium]|nr:4-(cytidine 5'-diphospho)-2-C-methyl-D-erythritol kinase [Opitutae bacterium]